MTLALAGILNAVFMLALLGALAFAMSRANRLKPHLASTVVPALAPVPTFRVVPARRARPLTAALSGARS
jgi:hypothetical protein